VGDSDRAGEVLLGCELRELSHPPGRAQPFQSWIQHCEASRVVAAILEALEPLEQYRYCIPSRSCAYDSAHCSTI
jgi:hypothetical protein